MNRLLTAAYVPGLEFITVDPKHQYRGAGGMLLKWGADLADELGAPVSCRSIRVRGPCKLTLGSARSRPPFAHDICMNSMDLYRMNTLQ